MATILQAFMVVLTASALLNFHSCHGFDKRLQCLCGPGNWVQIGSINSVESCPAGFLSTNIDGVQVCWKALTGCTSINFTAEGQSYSAVCGVAEAYAYGNLSAFRNIPLETIDRAYVDGLSITYGSPRQHLFTYAATLTMGGCPCKGGRNPPSFVGNDFYCGDDVLAPGEEAQSKWYPDTVLWHEATDCSDVDAACRNDARPWFSVGTVGGPTSDAVEVRSCQKAIRNEAVGIARLEIYIRVD